MDYANFQRAMDVILSWQWDYRLKIYINEADIINLIDLNDITDREFIELCFNTLDQKNPLDNDAGLSLVNYGSIAGYQEQFGKSYLEEFEITKINNKWNLVELDEGNLEIFVVKSAQGLNWYQDYQESLYHKDNVKLIDKIDVSGSDLLLEY